MAKRGQKRIDTVAADLVAARDTGTPVCLILGAGCSKTSGIPLWEQFAQEVLGEIGVEGSELQADQTSVQILQETLRDQPLQRELVAKLIDRRLRASKPSRGYRYLARLISQRFYRAVITTNWDGLLEDSLHRFMRSSDILVVTRDSAPDSYLAELIKKAGDRFALVKLHGDPKGRLRTGEDLTTRSVSRELLDALDPFLTKVHVVGSSGQDLDILQVLFRRIADADVLTVSPDSAAIGEALRQISSSTIGGAVNLRTMRPSRQAGLGDGGRPTQSHINVGEFDHYFCQLTLAVERRLLRTKVRANALKDIETALLRKEEVGLSYINSSQLTRMARAFVRQVTKLSTPDIVFFINDPSAPGGMELKKRIEEELTAQGIAVGVLHIEGEKNNRSFRRSFRGPDEPDHLVRTNLKGKDITNIHILDSITFSGNTMRIARETIRRWYPQADVRLGALVVSQMLLEQQEREPDRDRIYHDSVTDRFEIFFPWGVTQTTADFDRRFPSIERDRLVHIARRPWGAIEVLVDEELCSVRLLTIEAGRRLSFQRHLCRDELFVALDDNIGLDVCAEDLSESEDIFDPAVKSMVLEKGDYILVSRGIWHRTKASMDRVRLLEVSFGVYDQQYDIERVFDDFDRTNLDGAE